MSEKISREEVRHVAFLGRLQFAEAEEERFIGQMNDILKYMEKLEELDTREIPATTHVVQLENAFRPDEVRESLERTDILQNAPESDEVSFVVPRVI
jgi:aspartyl-tRNA(Asn)/glutamyl-tRNA(Gln) amidotransferase subunit C